MRGDIEDGPQFAEGAQLLQDRGRESVGRCGRRARIGGDRATSAAGQSECECRQERKTAEVHEVGAKIKSERLTQRSGPTH